MHNSEAPRQFTSGVFLCPTLRTEVTLETEVPRPWVHWPMTVTCKACNLTHVLNYEDVRQLEPAFGRE